MNTASATLRRLVRIRPSRDDVLDGSFLAALALLALLGFRTTFDGPGYLAAGAAGTGLGLFIAYLANVLRQPAVVLAAMTVVAFFLLGGAVALRGQAGAGVLPTAGAVHRLAEQSVHGWKDLLTTLPPVDGSGPLLVLPYLLGLLGGAAGLWIARRFRTGLAPVGAPLAMLVTVILLGTASPAARTLQGAVFAVLAMCWAAVRTQRRRPPVQNGSGQAGRTAIAAALLAAAGATAAVAGPGLPGAGSHQRTVLRSHVTPPFNVRDYPSPLAGFRKYVKDKPNTLYDAELFTVAGLPAGNRLRIAVLTGYDGAVWTAGPGVDAADSFHRVGRTITQDATGRAVSLAITVDRYSEVWLPDAGTVTGVRFGGPRAADHAGAFRFNLATSTGVVPDRLQVGDTYTVRAVLPAPSAGLPPAGDPTVDPAAVPPVGARAARWAGPSADPWSRIGAVAAALKQGAYSDGVQAAERQYLPGHGAWRLTSFLDAPQLVGNDEQYVAAFALLVNQLGYPARVVLGALPEADGVVRGRDVHAWVEVRLVDGSWRPLYGETFMPDRSKKPTRQRPPQEQQANGLIVPPPVTQRPPTSLLTSSDTDSHAGDPATHEGGGGFHLPAWLLAAARWGGPPLLAALAWCLAVAGAKSRRRHLRRTRGPVPTRIGRGWRELLDHARDLGAAVPAASTRREQAESLAQHGLAGLAAAADAGVFGPGDPPADVAAGYWRSVDAARLRMSRQAGRLRRLRAAVSPASLLPARVRRAGA